MYSSLDTIWVGTGEANDDVSAGSNSRNCSSDSIFMASSLRSGLLPSLRGCDARRLRPVPFQQHAKDRDRRRGVDPDGPGEDRNFAGQCGDFGLDQAKPAFDVVKPIFYVDKSGFHAAKPIFDARETVLIRREFLGSSDGVVFGRAGGLERMVWSLPA